MANETVLLQELWRLQKTSPTVALLPTGDATTPDAVGVDFPVVLRYEGEWLLFYTAFDGQQRSIAVAASPDLQGWERRGVVLRRGEEGQFDAGGVMAAWILRHNDWDEPLPKLRRGMFWLAYSGAATPDASAAAIGLAFSPDLTHWRRFDANPILSARDGELWEKGSVGSPCLLERENLFWLFYVGQNDVPSVGLALSTDFLVWSRDLENPLLQSETGLLGRPFLVRQYRRWWMLFGDEEGLSVATSEDLRHWRLLDEPPLTFDGLHRPASPYLFWHGGKLWLFFAAERDGQQGIFCVAG
jgi:hypothetical protein